MQTMAASKLDAIRDSNGQLPAFAWPGGYPLVYLSADYQAEWCADCANQDAAEPAIVGYYVHYEGAAVICEGCGAEIESAYGDPDSEDEAE